MSTIEDTRRGELTRRRLLRDAGTLGLLAAVGRIMPAYAQTGTPGVVPGVATPGGDTDLVELVIAETPFSVNGRTATAITINGTIPGPLVRLHEGRDAVLKVTNRLQEATSIHWHGLLVPPEMDGVPGVSFAGIPAGTTFTYRFPVKQSGTYWYHSHSGGQEMLGMYAPMILEPAEPEPLQYQREHVIMLSDWSFDSPALIMSRLKKLSSYYNYQQRTVGDFFQDVGRFGLWPTIQERWGWARMRMNPADIADVTGATNTFLVNGLSPEANWTGLFRPGEKLRLRFINGATMTFFDVRIPGLRMTVVSADGQPVQPVVVDEFRAGPAETYDVLVEPSEDRAYTLFAEPMDRSGYARGTLAPRPGMSAPIPPRRKSPLRSMADMGMDMSGMSGMEMPGMNMERNKHGGAAHDMPGSGQAGGHGEGQASSSGAPPPMEHGHGAMGDMSGLMSTVNGSGGKGGATGPSLPGSPPLVHGPDHHGPGNQAAPMLVRSRLDEPGLGLGGDGWRVLVYTDLKALKPYPDRREPGRQVELHITGHMERFMWSFDGKEYSEAKEPVLFHYGERLRLSLVNDTMMEHPIHLHGMWMELENGAGDYQPRKHTISVKPAERVTLAITADAPGHWAFHCHLLMHMELGMFRVVRVAGGPESGDRHPPPAEGSDTPEGTSGHDGHEPHGHGPHGDSGRQP